MVSAPILGVGDNHIYTERPDIRGWALSLAVLGAIRERAFNDSGVWPLVPVRRGAGRDRGRRGSSARRRTMPKAVKALFDVRFIDFPSFPICVKTL